MKKLRKNMEQQLMVVCFLFGLTGFCGLFMPTPAICDNSVGDEIISLNVKDRPLGEVLKNISIATDCQFSIDRQIANLRTLLRQEVVVMGYIKCRRQHKIINVAEIHAEETSNPNKPEPTGN